ncbi:hypothetical protein STEG23_016895 [Scotinomys teguina]
MELLEPGRMRKTSATDCQYSFIYQPIRSTHIHSIQKDIPTADGNKQENTTRQEDFNIHRRQAETSNLVGLDSYQILGLSIHRHQMPCARLLQQVSISIKFTKIKIYCKCKKCLECLLLNKNTLTIGKKKPLYQVL